MKNEKAISFPIEKQFFNIYYCFIISPKLEIFDWKPKIMKNGRKSNSTKEEEEKLLK